MGTKRRQRKTVALTFDSGALIAIERGDLKMIALLSEVANRNVTIHVPSGVLAQAWRSGAKQARLAKFLRSRGVEVVPLDEPLAKACGELCAATATSDVIDASVVLIGKGEVIVTSDPHDILRLNGKAIVESI